MRKTRLVCCKRRMQVETRATCRGSWGLSRSLPPLGHLPLWSSRARCSCHRMGLSLRRQAAVLGFCPACYTASCRPER